MGIIYLVKENNSFVSHCNCEVAPISIPSQLDCPWCGCGWLFSCIECRKAFTFAKAVELETTWEEIAEKDCLKIFGREPSFEEIQDWVEGMKEFVSEIELGESYVYLDGCALPANASEIDLTGWYAHHQLNFIPQKLALTKPEIKNEILSNKNYWYSHEVENRE